MKNKSSTKMLFIAVKPLKILLLEKAAANKVRRSIFI
jgi:hypothetical protein